jgi:hypothetical protein
VLQERKRERVTGRRAAHGELTGGDGERRRGCLGGGEASPPLPRPGGSSREALERQEREVLCGAACSGELVGGSEGRRDLV